MENANEIDLLMARQEGVPSAKKPVFWDRRLGVAANVQDIQYRMNFYDEFLPARCWFDEAAIMVPSKESRRLLSNELMGAGWDMFNSSADLVHANPFGTRYTVEYRFFRHRSVRWRIELMLLGQQTNLDGNTGFSPLHQALWYPNGQTPTWADHAELPIPHLSFKPDPEAVETYGAAKAVRNDIDLLRDKGMVIAQACQSTYGEFWYMLPSQTHRQLYVKPRINTRDS